MIINDECKQTHTTGIHTQFTPVHPFSWVSCILIRKPWHNCRRTAKALWNPAQTWMWLGQLGQLGQLGLIGYASD